MDTRQRLEMLRQIGKKHEKKEFAANKLGGLATPEDEIHSVIHGMDTYQEELRQRKSTINSDES